MLKDYEINKPILETDRLIIRKINESDVDDLKEWQRFLFSAYSVDDPPKIDGSYTLSQPFSIAFSRFCSTQP